MTSLLLGILEGNFLVLPSLRPASSLLISLSLSLLSPRHLLFPFTFHFLWFFSLLFFTFDFFPIVSPFLSSSFFLFFVFCLVFFIFLFYSLISSPLLLPLISLSFITLLFSILLLLDNPSLSCFLPNLLSLFLISHFTPLSPLHFVIVFISFSFFFLFFSFFPHWPLQSPRDRPCARADIT